MRRTGTTKAITADSETLLSEAGEDTRVTRSITRQVMVVTVATILLAGIFLSATAHAVLLINDESLATDTVRARLALRHTLVFDAEALAAIEQAYLLEGARIAVPAELLPSEASVPTGNADGAVLAWTPKRLGSEIFESIAPLRISAAVAVLLGITLILLRLHRLARHLDSRRAAARTLAGLDPLTGLANRLEFNDHLSRQVAGDEGESRPAALMLLDLDGFKAVNDRYGHVAGDALLRETAARLKALAGPGDLVARLGGDEFAVIRRESLSRGEIAEFASAIVHLLSAPYAIEGVRVSVTVSAGIARIPQDARQIDAAIRLADAALYRAKATAGGSFAFAETRPRPPASAGDTRSAA